MIDTSNWTEFPFTSIFKVEKGNRLTRQNMKPGQYNFISASGFNNGVATKIGNDEHLRPKGTMTICYDGAFIGRAFYQTEKYWASDSVNVLYPKFTLTQDIAFFLIAVLYRMGLRYAYKDKWTKEKMESSMIPLPSTKDGKPDWDYMTKYVADLKKRAENIIQITSSDL